MDEVDEMDAAGEADEAPSSQVLWETGSKVDALDTAGTWYPATIVNERGVGDERELLVHYKGWSQRWDEWLGVRSCRVRAAGGQLGPCGLFAVATKLEVGNKVCAQDQFGDWFDAEIVDESGTGMGRQLLVHYNGWNSRHDEWVGVCCGKLKAAGGEPADQSPRHPTAPWNGIYE